MVSFAQFNENEVSFETMEFTQPGSKTVFKPESRAGRLLLSLFIVFIIGAVLTTNSQIQILPYSITRVFIPFARWTRLMQRWSLFCPEPRRYSGLYKFEITLSDGTIREWQRPLPPNWNPVERLRAYNWQKFDTAANHMEDRWIWPDLVLWIAEKYKSEKNPPVRIRLLHEIADTPPPGEPASPSHQTVVFDYSVVTKAFHD